MRSLTLSVALVAALAVVAATPDRADAQYLVRPGISYYYPPNVSYTYTPNVVTPYTWTAPRTSYYYGPTMSTYVEPAPGVTYYPSYYPGPTYPTYYNYGYMPAWRYRRGWVYYR